MEKFSFGDVHKSVRLTRVAGDVLPCRLAKRVAEFWVRKYIPCSILPTSPVPDGVYIEFRVHQDQKRPNLCWGIRKLVGYETTFEQNAETVKLLVHKYVQYQQPWNRLLRWIKATLHKV
jgi:hypothetical protein